jgi:organic hydroperoxide reductase OsmC/OhrA
MARKRDVQLGRVETSVSTRLVWGDGTEHHLSNARMQTRVQSAAPDGEVRALIDEAFQHCPVCQAVGDRIRLDLEVVVVS